MLHGVRGLDVQPWREGGGAERHPGEAANSVNDGVDEIFFFVAVRRVEQKGVGGVRSVWVR